MKSSKITLPARLTTVSILVLALVAVVFGAFAYQEARRVAEKQAFDQLESLSAANLREINSALASYVEFTAYMPQAKVVRDLLKSMASGTLTQEQIDITRETNIRLVNTSPNKPRLEILDIQGKIICSTDKSREGMDLSKDPDFLAGKTKLGITAGRQETDGLYIYVAAPVLDDNGQVKAVIIEKYHPEKLLAITGDYSGMDKSGENVIGERIGDSIHYLTPRRFDTDNTRFATISISEGKAVPMVHATNGEKGIIAAPDYRGVKVLAAYAPLSVPGWGLVVKEDESEVLASTNRLGFILIGLLVVLIAVGVGVLYGIIGLFTKPITRLVDSVESFGEHGLDVEVPVTGGFEMETLATSFNTMVRNRRKAEEEIRDSEAKYRTTLMSIGDGVIVTDFDGTITMLNPIAEELTGWKEDEAIGKQVEEVFKIVNEETRAEVENPVRNVRKNGAIVGLANHTLLISKDGIERPIADSGAPIHDGEGINGVVLVFRDQTEEHQKQKVIQESEERFRVFFDSAPIGKSVTAPDGHMIRVNPALASILGYSQEELQTLDFAAITYPDDLAETRENIRALLAGEKEKLDLDKRYIRKDGHIVWTHAVSSLVHDVDGKPLYFLTSVEDITYRKEAEDALKQSEEQFRVMFDKAPIGKTMTGMDGTLIRVNPALCKMVGYTAEELESGTFFKITHPDDVALSQGVIDTLVAGKQDIVEFDKRYITRDSRTIWVHLSTTLLRDAKGNPLYLLTNILDITHRKEAEEALTVSETRYRRLFESAKDGILILDGDTGEAIDVNPFLVDMLGFPHDYFMGKRLWELGLFKDIAESKENFETLKRNEYIRFEDLPLATRDGRQLDVEFVSNSYPVDHKNIIQCNIRDITERVKAERAIKESEEKFRVYFDNDPAGKAVATVSDGQMIQVNPAFAQMVGYSEEELEAMPVPPPITHPDDMAPTKELIQELLDGKRDSWELDKRYIHKDGHVVWGRVTTTLFRDSNGKPQLFLTSILDITERKKAEEALRDSEERFRVFFDSGPIGKLMSDSRRSVIRVNQAICDILGYTAEEILGTVPGVNVLSHPDDVPATIEGFRAMEAGETDEWEADKRYIKKDGSIIWAHIVVSVVRDSDGKPIYFLTSILDITERKEAEEALKESEERFRVFFDSAPIGKHVVDSKGRMIRSNPAFAKMLGYTEEELGGVTFSPITHPDDMAESAECSRALLSGEKDRWEMEKRYIRKDGSPVWAHVTTAAVRDDDGKVLFLLTNIIDITERKKAEEQLRQASHYARSLLEASLDPLVTISSDGKITDVNTATERVTGIPRDQLIGTDFSDYFTEPEKARKGYKRAYDEGIVLNYPLAIRNVSGKITDVLYNASLYWDKSGEQLGVFATARDVTELKKAEEEVRQASLYSRSLIEASLDPLVTISPDGKITDVNEATEEATGLSRHILIGTDFLDYFTEPEKAREGYKEVFERGFVTDYPLAIKHMSGKVTDVLYNASVYGDEDGRILGVFAAARDVTERKKAEEALRRIEWMLTPNKFEEDHSSGDSIAPHNGDLTDLNTNRLILDSVGHEVLHDLAKVFIDLLGTSSAIYEKNGDYALGIFASGYCRMLDRASRQLCGTDDDAEALSCGKWLCHESCWTKASKTAIDSGQPTDIVCNGGIHLYAVPIMVGGESIGAINVGYSDPPHDPEKIKEIAEKYKADPDELLKEAKAYESRPSFIIDLAKKTLRDTANLIGAMVESKQAENALLESEARFRSMIETMISGCVYGKIVYEDGKPVDYIYLATNSAHEKLSKKKDVVGKRYSEVNPEFYGVLPEAIERYAKVAATGVSERFEFYNKVLDRWYMVSASSSRKGYFLAVFDDIDEIKRAQDALRESEERYRTTLMSIGDGVIVTDFGGRVNMLNSVAEDLTGWSINDAYGKPIEEVFNIINEDTRQAADNPVRRVESEGIIVGLANHTVLVSKDGTERPIADSGAPIRIEGDTINGVVLVFRDQTEERAAQLLIQNSLKLTETLNRIADVFLTVPDDEMFPRVVDIVLETLNSEYGVFGFIDDAGNWVVPHMNTVVWDKCKIPDKNYVYPRDTWGNSTWAQAIINKKTIFSNVASTNIPEGHISISRHISMPLVAQDKVVGLIQVANKDSDYTPHDLELLQSICQVTAPLLDARLRKEREEVARLLAVETLRESEERFRSMIENMVNAAAYHKMYYEDGVPVDYVFLNTNKAFEAVTGLKDVVGKKVTDVIPGMKDSSPELFEIYGRVALTGESERFVNYFPPFDKWYSISVSSPRKEHFLVVFDDITEQKKTEEAIRKLNSELVTRTSELETSNKELEAFSYSVSHDLRAPLRGIDGFSKALLEDYGNVIDAEGQGYLKWIRTGCTQMGNLIESLLVLSRVSRAELTPQSVDLSILAGEITDELGKVDPDRKVKIKFDKNMIAWGDRTLLRQLLYNLIGNAWKFTSKNPKAIIEFSVMSGPEGPVYKIHDNGVGFDMAYAGKLFGTFQRLHASTEFEGTGVGLATAQRVINRHMGRIWAESEVDKGTTFYFTLNLKNEVER